MNWHMYPVRSTSSLEQLRDTILGDARLLNISANDVHRPPPAGLHDRQNANSTRHHVLRSAYSHGVPREFPDEGLIKTHLGGQRLDGPFDSVWMKAGITDLVVLDPSEYPAVGNAAGFKPGPKESVRPSPL
jgi:hypothetical protein